MSGSPPIRPVEVAPVIEPWSPPTDAWSVRLEAWSDWLSPILVKEARQSLKSLQFLLTFAALLVIAWAVSIFWGVIGLSEIGGDADRLGSAVFSGYYWILAFPLIVVVPFMAYRSLAVEREDGTFELVSVTALTPEQIVLGKLGSAVLQILIYVSVVAPCIAFTYLLSGVDLLTIAVILFYLTWGSVFLCVTALMLSTVTKVRHWQILISVLFILALGYCYAVACGGGGAAIHESRWPLENWRFWFVQVVVLTLAATTAWLMFQCSAARISFAADNRSTGIRLTILLQQALALGFLAMIPAVERRSSDIELPVVQLSLGGLYWIFLGGLLIGETTELSPRAQRDLPQSFLGRMFFGILNPGPGTGYFFAVANSLVWAAAAGAVYWPLLPEPFYLGPLVLLLPLYIAFYVGLARLVLWLIERAVAGTGFAFQGGFLASGLLTILVTLVGNVLPVAITLVFFPRTATSWTLYPLDGFCIPKLASVSVYLLNNQGQLNAEFYAAAAVVLIAAIPVLVINAMLAWPEIDVEREEAPERVQAETTPPTATPEPTNPFDDRFGPAPEHG